MAYNNNADNAGDMPHGIAPASRFVAVLAAGEGRRFGSDVPKQFLELNGYPMLWWSVKAFHECYPDSRILLVLHPGYFDDWDIFYDSLPEEERLDVKLVCGGRSRLESVANALRSISDSGFEADALLAVHDAARPLVSKEMIARGWECCLKNGSAVPVVKITDSLRRLTPEGSEAVDRNDFVAVQTPQIFPVELLLKAYGQEFEERFTDDASLVENMGVRLSMYEGEYSNIKVTNPMDISIAELLMKGK